MLVFQLPLAAINGFNMAVCVHYFYAFINEFYEFDEEIESISLSEYSKRCR